MPISSARPRVLAKEELTESVFLLKFERLGMNFQTGQYVSVGLPPHREQREYSLYSGIDDDYLAILIKEVAGGKISKALRHVAPGDELIVDGPFGYFLVEDSLRAQVPLLFVATGTGISPFHSYLKTHPHMDYLMLHGARNPDEVLYRDLERKKVVSCVSRDQGGDFSGRVTNYLSELPVASETHCFLCGNCDMIYDAFDLLKAKGVATGNIFTEVYF